MSKKVWMQLGILMDIPDYAESKVFGNDLDVSAKTLEGLVKRGNFKPFGKSRIPEKEVAYLNQKYGTEYTITDVKFDMGGSENRHEKH